MKPNVLIISLSDGETLVVEFPKVEGSEKDKYKLALSAASYVVGGIDGEVVTQNLSQPVQSGVDKNNTTPEIKFTDLPLIAIKDASDIIKSRLLELPSGQYGKETVERIVETTKHAMITFYSNSDKQ
ncbi:hypothetical protein [Yersinia frederiksenii]|uniref:hypothetical protein n=1 Tax=Yersinia frederiksenii TaxID=29484 RepID=UPI000BFBC310|nr:hypothetical protein [Yersinia frederiksenii]ATM85065.1 hypothetical protein CRN74_02615 [Yersinia frederiksenii]